MHDVDAKLAELDAAIQRQSIGWALLPPDQAARREQESRESYQRQYDEIMDAYIATLPDAVRWLFRR